MAHAVAVPLLVLRAPRVLPYVYIAELLLLVSIRLVYYYQLHWHYFCLDFCYFGNATLVAYLLFFPHSERLFVVCFAIAHGPLLFAVVAYRNSLVPHSLDKMTSCFIHIAPPIVLFALRWHAVAGWSTCAHADLVLDLPQRASSPAAPAAPAALWTLEDVCESPGSLVWLLVVPMAAFAGHQLLYFLIVQVLPNKTLREDKTYLTSYRYLMSLRGLVYNLATCFGYRFRVAGYAVVCLAYGALSLLPMPLWWSSYWANVAVLAASLLVMTHNGAGFYTEVFSRKYAAAHGLHAQQLAPDVAEELA
uniref:Glycerophosphocholine acyltransferase 1 n=1 Tax=Bicosoecida sp. CB-2014 TaxID=1486930 RepID=A0A7S1G2R6_9STRA